MKKYLLSLLTLSLAFVLCFTVPVDAKPKLSTKKVTLEVGESKTIKLSGNKEKVKWSVSNKNVKIISKSNSKIKIKAGKVGKTTIKAKIGNQTYKCVVTVKKKVKLEDTKISIYVGNCKTVKLLNNSSTVKWSASNSNIKIISKSKKYVKFKAVKAGKTTITAKIGTKKYKCTVTVKNKQALSDKEISIEIGNQKTIKLKNKDDEVEWFSTDSNVAKITSKDSLSAKISAINSGECYIIAESGGKLYKCIVTVTNSAAISKDNIEYSLHKTSHEVVGIFKNNNKKAVDLSVKLVYYKNGTPISYDQEDLSCFSPNSEYALSFSLPYDSDYNYVEYDNVVANISVEEPNYKIDVFNYLDVTGNKGSNNDVILTIKNKCSKKIIISISVVYYDSFNNIIGHSYEDKISGNYLDANSQDISSAYHPYDEKYEDISYSSFKIFKSAYYYSFD